MSVSFVLEALVVLAAIIMGTRAGGVGVGLWGGLGTFVLVFVFGEAPGEPPAAAVAIILGVVTAASMMQAAGGIDWMVAMAARVIEAHPKQITVIAPLTAFAFCVGSGTGNIIYPLLPVIYDVSYKNHIRPARPLTLTVVQSGMALAASPVSAAMAAMLTLTEVAPYNLGLTQILAITLPACIIGIVVTALVVNRMWKDLDDDPDVQERIASGVLAAPEARQDAVPVGASSGARGRRPPRPWRPTRRRRPHQSRAPTWRAWTPTCRPRPRPLPRPSRHPAPPRSRTPRRAATRRWSSFSEWSPS